MTGKHVILGCRGPVGVALMEGLAAAGREVVGVCRTGRSEAPAGVRIEAGDVADVSTARRLADGADVVYGCMGLPYPEWLEKWPPIVEGMLAAAESAGARLVFADNLYGYGPQSLPLTEDLPDTSFGNKPALRARMGRTMLEAHGAGRAPVALVRASDFFGPRVTNAALGERVFANVLAGKPAEMIGDLDQPHTFTYAPDFARALQRIGEAEDDVYGQAWHVPNPPTRNPREIVDLVGELMGKNVKVRSLGGGLLAVLALFSPLMRELKEMMYQWDRPYRVDHTKWVARFGEEATPLENGLRATLDWYRTRSAPGGAG